MHACMQAGRSGHRGHGTPSVRRGPVDPIAQVGEGVPLRVGGWREACTYRSGVMVGAVTPTFNNISPARVDGSQPLRPSLMAPTPGRNIHTTPVGSHLKC
eukprot:366077-Chlamydomonas_euryale.AAC.5